jgi:hypothetical protein
MMPFLRQSACVKQQQLCIVRAGAAFTGGGPRFFATNTATKSKRTRRRKSLAISHIANSTTITTKDRLRTVIDKNKIKASLLPTRDQASDVLNLAQSRVTWVRDKVYEFWGASAGDANGGSSSSSAAAAAVSNRPVKKDINMDTRWWIWNILFAVLPALTIGVYCEFRGQKLMHEYYTGLELEQMKRILGEDAVLDEWVVPPPENFVVRIVRFGREVTAMLLGSMSGSSIGSDDHDARDDDVNASIPQNRVDGNRKQLAIEQPTTTRTPATVGKSANGLTVVPRQDAAPASSADDSTNTNSSYKDDLVQRIEHLEGLLLKQERERQRQIKYQLERLQQSGTQNRMEDDLIQKWKHQAGTPVSGRDAQQSATAAAAAPTNHQAREQHQQQQQLLPITGEGDDEADNETSGWSSLSKVKKVAEATLRKAADQIMPLLGETGRNGEQDKREPTKDPAANEASSTFLNVHPNESSIRGQTDNDTSVSGHGHVVPQDVVVRPGSSVTEVGTDRKGNKWWQLW